MFRSVARADVKALPRPNPKKWAGGWLDWVRYSLNSSHAGERAAKRRSVEEGWNDLEAQGLFVWVGRG